MPREIKFRAWNKEEKKFLKPCFESEEDRYNKGMAMIRWNSQGKVWLTLSGYRDEDGNPYQIDAEIMQYTGLKDKNGKEIYEGDIVRYVPGDEEFYPDGVIKWDRAEFRVFWKKDSFMSNDNLRKDLFFWANEREIEVIGNIYENPELLKGE